MAGGNVEKDAKETLFLLFARRMGSMRTSAARIGPFASFSLLSESLIIPRLSSSLLRRKSPSRAEYPSCQREAHERRSYCPRGWFRPVACKSRWSWFLRPKKSRSSRFFHCRELGLAKEAKATLINSRFPRGPGLKTLPVSKT